MAHKFAPRPHRHFQTFKGSPGTACGLSFPKFSTRDVAQVSCPSCLEWLTKNIEIRTSQLEKKQVPDV